MLSVPVKDCHQLGYVLVSVRCTIWSTAVSTTVHNVVDSYRVNIDVDGDEIRIAVS